MSAIYRLRKALLLRKKEMEMNGTSQVLTYADDVNLIGDDIRKVEQMHKCY